MDTDEGIGRGAPATEGEGETLESLRAEAGLARTQARVLESIAADAPLDQILTLLIRLVEELIPGMHGSVLQLDESGRVIREALGPSLPAEFLKSLQGLAIGPEAGTCGTAMYLDKPVGTADILQDPHWRNYLALVEPHGLRACWSTPIRSRGGRVLGSFAMYWRQPRTPAEPDPSFATAVALAGVAIECKRSAAALMASEERFRSMVENISEVFFTTDLEGRVTYASPAFANLTGIPPEEAWGASLLGLALPQDVALFKESFARRLAGTLECMEHRLASRSGQVRWVRTSSRPLRRGSFTVGLLGVMMDITARKHTEEQLRQSQKMEAIGRLAGGVAHDFNNLLTAINGYSSLALTLVQPADPVHDHLVEILKSGERAAALTRQLLAYGRKQVLSPTVLDLNGIVTKMGEMLRRLIGADVSMALDLAPDLLPVRADRGQVEQVLLNLVVNARDAMPKGGTLTLSTRNVELGRDPISGQLGSRPDGPCPAEFVSGPYVRLAVADTGVGMSEEVKARLFEPFFTTKPLGAGTGRPGPGLGLPVVYGIVMQSDGAVAVESEPGKGCRICLFFPEASRYRAAGATGLPPGGDELILLAEDEAGVRDFMLRSLERQGYQVAVAGSGLEALRILEERGGQVRLIITDVVMPEMGGAELAEEAKRLLPGIPVLFISGYRELGETSAGREGGMFLHKPFSPDALALRVRQALELSAAGNGK